MAITGTFAADFSNFSTAVDNAEVKLRSFQDGSTKVEAALARMTDSFSGRKLIQDATEMVAAIEKIGGASKLTEQELAKVGKTVEEASAKMRAMGVEVPAGFTKITEATGHTTESMGVMADAAGTITSAFAGAFTAEAIFEGIKRVGEAILEVTKSVMEYSITLRNLSLQTGIGIENLQVLGAAVKDFGVDSDQLGKAIFQLGRRIAGNDDSAANAFHLLGLSIKDFKTTAPEEVFLQVERRMASMGNTFQTATASSELFGARLGASLIAASYNLDTTIEDIKKTNTVMSVDAVHAAAEFSESIDHLKLSLLAMAGNALQPAMTNLDRFVTNLSSAKGRVEDLKLALIAFASAGPTGVLNALFMDIKTPGKDVNLPASAGTVDPEAFMLALRKDALQALDAEQVKHLEQLKEMGQLTEKNAAGIGVSAGQFKQYEERLKAATAATTELKKSQAEFDAIALAGYEKRIAMLASAEQASKAAYSFTGQIANLQQLDLAEQALARTVFNALTSLKDRAKVVEESTQRHMALLDQEAALQVKQAGLVNAAVVAEFEAQTALNKAYGVDADGSIHVQLTALELLQRKLAELTAQDGTWVGTSKQKALLEKQFSDALYEEAKAQDAAYQKQLAANDAAAKVPSLLAAATAAVNAYNFSLNGGAVAPSSLIRTDTQSQIQAGLRGGTASNLPGGGYYNPGNSAGIPVFGDGGPTTAGLAMLHNNEYVVPSGGALVARGGGSGSTTNIFNITQPLGTPAAIAAAVDQALMARQRNTGQRLPVS